MIIDDTKVILTKKFSKISTTKSNANNKQKWNNET